jgi:predicted GNAT family acetyltransferase
MDTNVVHNAGSHRYEIQADGATAGFTAYEPTSTARSFTHTEIDTVFEGKGLGSVLVRQALDATRADGLSVLPFCPFVRAYIERHPEYRDLVPADQHARFHLEATAT